MRVRAFFLAIAAFCLVCIGVHAAADRVDNQILALIEPIDAAIDGIVSRWALTRPLADWIDAAFLVKTSRSIALLWELVASFVLASAVFAYEQQHNVVLKVALDDLRRALRELRHAPRTLATLVRPLIAVCFVLAGAAAIGRTVHGALALQGWPGVGRVLGGVAWVATLALLGLPAVAASVVNVEGGAMKILFPRTWTRELIILGLTLPLALFGLASLL